MQVTLFIAAADATGASVLSKKEVFVGSASFIEGRWRDHSGVAYHRIESRCFRINGRVYRVARSVKP